jgi:putative membrane protein
MAGGLHERERRHPPYAPAPEIPLHPALPEVGCAAMPHLLAFIVRLVVSAAVLWLAVAWVSPGNPFNTFGRAVVVSILLSIAYYITLARFLWFLILPWLLYVAIWLAVVEGNYGLGFWRALLVAIVLVFLSWVVSALFGIRTFRSE